MNLIPKQVSKQPTQRVSEKSEHSFTRASHFVILLIPQVAAQAYVQVKDYIDEGTYANWLGYTGIVRTVSGWIHLAGFLFFIFGIGSAILLIYGMNLFEKWEENNHKSDAHTKHTEKK